MSAIYHSILFCDHPKEGFVNVYIDGLILGQINKANNKFTPDPLIEHRNVFGSLEAMRNHVLGIMDAVVGKSEEPKDDYEGGDGHRRISVTAPPPDHPSLKKQINLNGEVMDVHHKGGEFVLSYEDVVRMVANKKRALVGVAPLEVDAELPHLSVVYHHRVPFDQLPGERDGSLWLGSKPVKVTDGMVINAVHTGNA